MTLELSLADARHLAISAQGLTGRRHREPLRLLDSLGAIQIDTISVVARSHELVCLARLGPISRSEVTRALWSRGRTFEYWAHAACVLPLQLWPLFAWRRRGYIQRYAERTREHREILARLSDLGPQTTGDLGGARTTPGWWEWTPTKTAVEQLLARGEVVCTERRGFQRVYRLAEQAIPAALLGDALGTAECHAQLVRIAAERLGVASEDDLADYFRLRVDSVRAAAEASGLQPVTVRGWPGRAWADPLALAAAGRRRRPHRPVLLSPFDSLIWYRRRVARLFEFHYRIEVYTPASKRQHGYFVMPLLAGGRLVGRADPRRDGAVLRIRRLSMAPRAVTAMAQALRTAARWVDCDEVAVEAVTPATLADPLRRALLSGESDPDAEVRDRRQSPMEPRSDKGANDGRA